MIAVWMLYSVVVGGLAAAAAGAAERAFRAGGLAVRFVWSGALLATLALSLAGLSHTRATPEGSVPAAAAAQPAEGATSAAAATSFGWVTAAVAALDRVETRSYALIARRAGVERGLLMGWALASVALALLFGATLVRCSRARRQWIRHLVGGVSVYVAGHAGPALVGLRRPEIVIPAWLLRAPESDQRLVIQHEQEHRNARDHLLLAGSFLLVCLLPWNPALWWMLRRTRLAVELDCDARVLRRGVRVREYGALLLDVASHGTRLTLAAPALSDSRTHLERRIMAMTENPRTRGPRHATLAALGAALLAAAACSADMPTAAEIDELDVAAAETKAETSGFLRLAGTGVEPLFVVDGVITPSAQARAIAPGEIESIEVSKAGAAAAVYGERATQGVVHIRTRGGAAAGTYRYDGAEPEVRMKKPAESGQEVAQGRLRLRNAEATAAGKAPLFIIDGVMAPAGFNGAGLDGDRIESIEVIKGPAAVKAFGERGANGVVRITLKK